MINGWIYKIKDLTNDNIYIGSTMSKFGFKHRCGQHKNDLKRYLNGTLNYRAYFEVMQNDNYEYSILQELEDCCKDDLLNTECITINQYRVYYQDKLVNKCLMTKRFNELNCNLNNIL